MAIDFSQINLEVIDLTTNTTPDIYINQTSVTFSKRVLDDLNYPQTVQYCTDIAHKVFAIRVCKSNEQKATPFSKAKGEQSTMSSNSKNMHDILASLIPSYAPKKRYKITGELDAENRVMYFDMARAEISDFRAVKG